MTMCKISIIAAVALATALLAEASRGADTPAAGGLAANRGTALGTASTVQVADANDGSTAAGAATQPDNTDRNKRDSSGSTLTPGDQGSSEADRETTRRIRRAIMANDQLSTNAKNIKIITVNGKVTLRGPVKNEQEQKTIQSIVEKIGITSLDNQLEVKATNQ